MLANLYIEKGDEFKKFQNYNKVLLYYNKAAEVYPDANIRLIEKYYINNNGNKYHKLSEFYNWFIQSRKLNLKAKLNSEFPSNQSIESLIDSIKS